MCSQVRQARLFSVQPVIGDKMKSRVVPGGRALCRTGEDDQLKAE